MELSKISRGIRGRGARYIELEKSRKPLKSQLKLENHFTNYTLLFMLLLYSPLSPCNVCQLMILSYAAWIVREYRSQCLLSPLFSPLLVFFSRISFPFIMHNNIIPFDARWVLYGGITFDSTGMHALSSYVMWWSGICRYPCTRCFLGFRISIIEMKNTNHK